MHDHVDMSVLGIPHPIDPCDLGSIVGLVALRPLAVEEDPGAAPRNLTGVLRRQRSRQEQEGEERERSQRYEGSAHEVTPLE